jgi:hypothetical protein
MYTKLKEALHRFWEAHICTEDPDDCRKRLIAQTEKEIRNRAVEILALHEAVQAWALEHEKR